MACVCHSVPCTCGGSSGESEDELLGTGPAQTDGSSDEYITSQEKLMIHIPEEDISEEGTSEEGTSEENISEEGMEVRTWKMIWKKYLRTNRLQDTEEEELNFKGG
ncbi:uncharacterized protein N7515_006111 [Penicillium bovifimosum]|uniref:Uncharacterized protein n=1 Tax=Penicillium bovifimosum TaxID=126998 RepID=A0A9W9GU76_9EURO|nr:uncharacterized protein N7515_006111 [Penicillium bovifimosum]KAJ5130072.1 hypothetical protein N7515_006111 [Penicillium bovifimosum]